MCRSSTVPSKETRTYRTKERPSGKQGHCNSSLFLGQEISNGPTTRRYIRRSSEAGAQAEDQKLGDMGAARASSSKSQVEDGARTVDRHTAEDLGQRGDEQLAQGKPQRRHGDGEDLDGTALEAELALHDVGTGGEHGRGQVGVQHGQADQHHVAQLVRLGPVARIGRVVRAVPVDDVRVCWSALFHVLRHGGVDIDHGAWFLIVAGGHSRSACSSVAVYAGLAFSPAGKGESPFCYMPFWLLGWIHAWFSVSLQVSATLVLPSERAMPLNQSLHR